MDGLAIPNGIRLSRSDTPETIAQVLPVNAYGMKNCNWK